MNTVIGVLSTVFVALILSLGMPNLKDYDNINVSGEEIIEIPSIDDENEDIININNFYRLETESYAVRAFEVDLISEYDFLEKIAEQSDLYVTCQLKNYVPKHIVQKYEEYSDFQQNIINFYFKDNGEFGVEIEFSENEILGTWKENENKTFLNSIIENEAVHIFEWKIPGSDYENNCRAQFTINGMNFVIKIINASHEKSMNIIKTTIREYKNFEEEKEKSGYIKIKESNLYSEGTSLRELVKYDDKLYGRAFSEIDYGGNPNGPIGVIDRLIAREYIPIYNGETNTARFLNARVDSVTERRLILLAEEGAVPFERVYIQESVNDNKIIKPTEKEILSMYEKAQEIYLWFAETVPTEKIDYKNSIEDGVYLIKDERFSTLKELKEYMSEIFTTEIIEKIEEKRFDTNLIFEKNGKLYMREYMTSKDIYYGEEKIKDIEYKDKNTIVITVLAEVLGQDMVTIEKEEEHKFILIYDNGSWKFSEIYCIGFYL